MTAQPLQISWNNFTGGINDQKYQGQPGRYYTGFNVDTRRYDVMPSGLNTLEYTYEDIIGCAFNQEIVGGNGNIIWLENGKIYHDTTLKHTLATGKQGQIIGYMKVSGTNRLYYFHNTLPSITPKYIHRSDKDGGSFLEGHLTYTSTDGSDFLAPKNGMQVKSEGFRILFTHYNNLFQLSNTEVVTKLIGFPSEENIVGITEFLGEYKIYTTIGNIGSKIYKWDGISSLADLSLDLKGLVIGSVTNDGAYDYMIADGNYYKVAGVQYQELYHAIQGKILGNIDGDIYLNYPTKNSQVSLAIFGDLPGYPQSITPKYIIDSSSLSTGVNNPGCLTYGENDVFYGVGKELYSIGGNSTPTSITSYIESLVFIGSNIQYEKEVTQIILKFSGTSDNCLIKLECQINESGSWVSIWQGKNADISGLNHGIKIYKSMFLNPLGDFNTIRFKVSFLSNGISQCRFYGLDLLGNEEVGK